MDLLHTTIILLLVVDPFGNIPIVLAVLDRLSNRAYRLTILRETALGFVVLCVFAFSGELILDYLSIDPSVLSVAGGVILFLISLKMIFSSAKQMFDEGYSDDPIFVPIAVPLIAGPSAITTAMILHTKEQIPSGTMLIALMLVIVASMLMFLVGRELFQYLGHRVMQAIEKLMGLLLILIAVNMMLFGIRDFFNLPG